MDEDQLMVVALQLASRIRDDDPEANGRWLAAQVPSETDRWRLHFIQAALTPVDRPVSELLDWVDQPPVDSAVYEQLVAERFSWHGRSQA